MTDFYELNMAASYLRRGMTEPATFSLFVRRLPETRGFLVAAGLEDCLPWLESFAFDDEDLEWLSGAGFDQETLDAFASIRFTGDVHAVPEGRVVLADEPLMEVTAPLPEAQLLETFLLNQVTYQTAVATKAARCRLAAPDIHLVDFALRRTHGVDAGMAFARVSAMAGFTATSNVEAARRFGLQATGTMAHSYIEAFDREEDAFRAFAEDVPGRTTFLVDTYDTLEGVEAAVRTIRELGLTESLAVRIDSGDLAGLAREARRLLDGAGLPEVRIFVSGGLDEHDLERITSEGAPIDGAGVGTRVAVSDDAPYLDTVYKLVEYAGRPVLKLSAGKATLPGRKQVWRRLPHEDDVLGLRDEAGPEGGEPLLEPVMRRGVRAGPPDTLEASRGRLESDLRVLPPAAVDLRSPVAPRLRVSPGLGALTDEISEKARRRLR